MTAGESFNVQDLDDAITRMGAYDTHNSVSIKRMSLAQNCKSMLDIIADITMTKEVESKEDMDKKTVITQSSRLQMGSWPSIL